jgi:hypothetical protein
MSASSAVARARLHTYLLVSAALLLPVLAWPALMLTDVAMNPAADIAGHWRLAATALLLVAVASDSLLAAHANRSDSLVPVAAWLVGMGLWGPWACSRAGGHWLLGVLFFIHALRPAHRLWRGATDWWLWPAWGRDVLAATALFLWPRLLG